MENYQKDLNNEPASLRMMKKQEKFEGNGINGEENFNFNSKKERFSALKNTTKSSAEFILTLLRSINPDSYRRLNEESLGKAIKFFLSLTFITLMLAFIIYFPSFNSGIQGIKSNLNSFTSLSFNPNISANSSIQIVKGVYYFKGVNESNNSNSSNAREKTINGNFLTFENNNFYVRKPCIPLLPFYCSIKKTTSSEYSYNKFFNVKQNTQVTELIKDLFILLLPYIFIILYIIISIRIFIITIFVAFATFLLLITFRKKPSFLNLFKMSIYSSSIFIILSTLGYSSYVMKIFSLSAYLLLFAFGVLINYLNVDL